MTAVLKSRSVLWYFIAFFGVVAAADATMITLALRTNSGIITDHPYEKGIAYNRVVAAEQAQEKLGWKAIIALDKDVLQVHLQDAKGKELIPDSMTAHITRPTQSGMDFDLNIKNSKAPVTFPVPGLWEVRIFANVGAQTYQQSQRMVIP